MMIANDQDASLGGTRVFAGRPTRDLSREHRSNQEAAGKRGSPGRGARIGKKTMP